MNCDAAAAENVCALIEGPRWADCKFYAQWLRAAAEAEALWQEALEDREFAERVSLVTCMFCPSFEIGAFLLLARLSGEMSSFILPLSDEYEPIEFCLLNALGFFQATGRRYQMTIPSRLTLTLGHVKRAAVELAATESAENGLRPETLIVTMPISEAKAWQTALGHIDESLRLADRRLLLDDLGDGGYPRRA